MWLAENLGGFCGAKPVALLAGAFRRGVVFRFLPGYLQQLFFRVGRRRGRVDGDFSKAFLHFAGSNVHARAQLILARGPDAF